MLSSIKNTKIYLHKSQIDQDLNKQVEIKFEKLTLGSINAEELEMTDELKP